MKIDVFIFERKLATIDTLLSSKFHSIWIRFCCLSIHCTHWEIFSICWKVPLLFIYRLHSWRELLYLLKGQEFSFPLFILWKLLIFACTGWCTVFPKKTSLGRFFLIQTSHLTFIVGLKFKAKFCRSIYGRLKGISRMSFSLSTQ